MTLKCAIIMCEKGTESIASQIQQLKEKGLDLVELRLDRYLFLEDTTDELTKVPNDETAKVNDKISDTLEDVPDDKGTAKEKNSGVPSEKNNGDEVSTESEIDADVSVDESESIEVLVPVSKTPGEGIGDDNKSSSQVETEKPEETIEPKPKPSIEQLENIIRESSIPVLCSVQRKENGGWFEGDLDEKRALLKKIIEYSPTYLEVELDDIQIDKTFFEILDEARKKSIKVIISKYNAEGCYSEEEFEYILRSMYEMNGDIYKICCNISSFTHLANIFGSAFEMRKDEKSFTFHGTGKLGNKCAQYAPILGSVMAFCSPSKDEVVEKGLVDIDLLNEQWNVLTGKDILL